MPASARCDLLPEHREAVLRELHGETYRQIARAQRVPVNTVRTRIFRARAAITEAIA